MNITPEAPTLEDGTPFVPSTIGCTPATPPRLVARLAGDAAWVVFGPAVRAVASCNLGTRAARVLEGASALLAEPIVWAVFAATGNPDKRAVR